MFVNFAAIITALGGESALFRIANEARPSADYYLNSILPERNVFSYHVDAGSMTIRTTMAGMVGMDAPYPPGGIVDASTFLENTAKLGIEVPLTEKLLRAIQDFMLKTGISNNPTNEAAQSEVLNFYDKMIVQALTDTSEWLRGQVLSFGTINWSFNKKDLVVSYGVPAGNIFPQRVGTAHYGGTASAWWTDVQNIRKALRAGQNMRILAHPDTIDLARYNPANNMVVTAGEGTSSITFRKIIPATGGFTADAADTVTIIGYGAEGETINPANPATTLLQPFLERGKLIGVASPGRRGFRVGDGSTQNPEDVRSLGYTHMAPTTESGGQPGRWGRLFVPQQQPWMMIGQGAMNMLPVVENPELLAIASTDMA